MRSAARNGWRQRNHRRGNDDVSRARRSERAGCEIFNKLLKKGEFAKRRHRMVAGIWTGRRAG